MADGGSFLPDFASNNRLIHRHTGEQDFTSFVRFIYGTIIL